MLTIGELASFVGITVRTVRHYHAIGLLDEPPRDQSGYRRYDAQALIRTARIKVLADAGVPLARIPALLDASPTELHEAITEFDQRIADEIDRLTAVRASLRRLRAPALPPALAHLLDALQRIGVSQRTIHYERDGWIMLLTLFPHLAEELIAEKAQLLAEADFVWLYRRMDEAFDWDPDDARIDALAAEAVTRINLPTTHRASPRSGDSARMQALLASYGDNGPASWKALTQRMQERMAGDGAGTRGED